MILIVILLLASVLRLAMLSESHFRTACEAQQRGDFPTALQAYTWSIRNYFPGNPRVSQALRGALEITDTYRLQGKNQEAIQGLRDLQAALYAIRSFYQPCRDSLPAIEARLNRVSSKPNDPS
jgi:hypothetical protein